MGLVKKCVEKDTGKVFAVKIIRVKDDELVTNLLNEFKHLKKLENENLIKIYSIY